MPLRNDKATRTAQASTSAAPNHREACRRERETSRVNAMEFYQRRHRVIRAMLDPVYGPVNRQATLAAAGNEQADNFFRPWGP